MNLESNGFFCCWKQQKMNRQIGWKPSLLLAMMLGENVASALAWLGSCLRSKIEFRDAAVNRVSLPLYWQQ
jgi:hypothetical protein